MKKRLVGNTYLVPGGPERIEGVLSLLREEGIETRLTGRQAGGNPDIYVRTYRHFGIEEARELRERASLKPLGLRRAFVIASPSVNREAQNALLKTLEEPPGNALFFFIVPSPESLIPTFRSRVHMLRLGAAGGEVDVRAFLSSTPQKRLDLIKPLLEKGEDDRRDFGAILSFLSSLERALSRHPDGLKAVYRARMYVTDKGALVKPLLEQVALLIPKI